MKSSRAVTLLAGVVAVCASAQTPDFNTGQAARLVLGQKNFTLADFGATNQLIGSPAGLAFANGTLWVVDANRLGSTPNNNRVLRFSDLNTYPSPTDRPDVSGSTCGACRGVASLVLGQPDFVSTSRSLSATGMRAPTSVASDGKVLIVSDTDNNRVLIWNSLPRANGQPADVVIGQADFTHNGTASPPTQTSLRGPEGVWISNGKLFVADTQDNRILIYNKIPTSNNAPADVVVGQSSFTAFVQPDLTSKQPITAADNMQTPIAVSSDGVRLFVADLGQNRVLIWNTVPTSNGAPADIALGQPDLVSSAENNSFTITDATVDSSNNPKGVKSVLCQSTSTDSDNTPVFPTRCGATLSFPRFVISDGKRLYVADGGNDRVLIFNSIPKASGASPDIILGQPDEFSDHTGENPDGSNAFQTPTSLAWDGTNLYVSDGFNRRVVVYSPAIQNVPLDGVRNAASQQIYALGTVTISGSATAKDTVTITINGGGYTYAVKANDTLETIVQGLAKNINAAPDANVSATTNLSALAVVLTARLPGTNGGNITLAASVSTNATVVATTSGTTLNIYLQNPSQIAPGTVIEVNGKNLCDSTATADMTQDYLPTTLKGCTVYVDGVPAPLLFVSPAQANVQMMNEAQDRTSVSIYVRNQHADGSVTVTTPVASTIVPQNPGLFAEPGNDPRKGIIFHGSSSAFDLVGVDGTVQAGDVATITININTYNYTVVAADTLATIRDHLIDAINSAPDPNVHASVANEYFRIALTANTPGPQGEGISVTVAVTTATTNTAGALLLLTAYNPTLCCSNVEGQMVSQDNPAVPGELLYTFATGLGVTNPQDTDTGRVFPGGSANPPAVPVDSILTGGTTANVVSAGLLPGAVGVYYVQFQLNSGLASNTATQMTIAQQAFVSNVVTFPVAVPGLGNHLVVSPDKLSVNVGDTVNFTVTALDYKGNIATSYTDTVHLTSTDGTATIPADAALATGMATFAVTFNTAGLQSITVTDTAATSITGKSPSILVK
jgi:plastocyanin